MGGERLYSDSELGPGSSAAIAPDNRSLGEIFQCSQAGRFIVGGRVWVEADVFPQRWQVWRKSGAVQLADLALASLSPSGTGWFPFTLAALGASPIALSTATDYVVNSWTPSGAGNYVFRSSTSYPFGMSPLSASGPIFRNGGLSSQIPDDETFTNGRFYVDVILDVPGFGPRPLVAPSQAAQRSRRW